MLIGLHGKARSGKDSAYDIIHEENPQAVRLAFADKMKQALAGLLNISVEEVDRFKLDGSIHLYIGNMYEGCMSGREVIQRFGTESHRDVFGYDFWVNQLLPIDCLYADRGTSFIVTDVRFDNEAQRIKDLGGEVWHIVRPDLSPDDQHQSETPLPDELIDTVIHNDSSLEVYRARVLEAFARAGVRHGTTA